MKSKEKLTNGTLNTMLLKMQQERILELEKENQFFRQLCSDLSKPIKK